MKNRERTKLEKMLIEGFCGEGIRGTRNWTLLAMTIAGTIYSQFVNPREDLKRNGFHYDVVEKEYPGYATVRYNSISLADYLKFLNNKK